MKACAVNDIAATDASNIAICRDLIQVFATSRDITSAVWFASSFNVIFPDSSWLSLRRRRGVSFFHVV